MHLHRSKPFAYASKYTYSQFWGDSFIKIIFKVELLC